jgi:hypothetical protein
MAAVINRRPPAQPTRIGHRTVLASGAQAGLLALAARTAIVLPAGAMAPRQMGLANEFGGAIAVAAALAFGIGARDAAGRTVEGWVARLDADQVGAGTSTGGDVTSAASPR